MAPSLAEAIRSKAVELGFDLVAFTAARLDPRARQHLADYVRRAYHGDMGWMAGTLARRDLKRIIEQLLRTKRVLYYRGAAGGYCLWPNSSVNLERAYEDAARSLGAPQRIGSAIQDCLEPRPIVARSTLLGTCSSPRAGSDARPAARLRAAAPSLFAGLGERLRNSATTHPGLRQID